MKKYVIGIMCIGFMGLVGCSNISYSTATKDGDKSSIHYNRLGLQSINDCKVEKNADGSLKLEFSKQEGGEKIVDIMADLAETVKSMANKPEVPIP